MGAIDERRKVLQDFLVPELRAIAVRLDALEERFEQVDTRFGAVDNRLDRTDQKIHDVERRAEKRHHEVLAAIRQVVDLTSIQQRLARLESKESAHQ